MAGTVEYANSKPLPERSFSSEGLREQITPADASARADTFFLFAAEGAGSMGSPGTTSRGWSFDWLNPATHEVEAAPGGWYSQDATAQEGYWWHLADVDICAGSDTDMSAALPLDYPTDPENNLALWCGRDDPCGWTHARGYGNNWEQWLRLHLAPSSELVVNFDYSADFEGSTFDYFQVFVEVDGELEEFLLDNTEGPSDFLSREVLAEGNLGDVVFSFKSDGAYSDQDGLFDTNVGAVWIDNLVIEADGLPVLATDFEDGLLPAEFEFTGPPTAGDFAALYNHLPDDGPCIVNPTFAWAFFDSLTLNPEYGNHPVIAYGPPYVENYVVSPVLSVDHLGRELGSDVIIDEGISTFIDFWVKRNTDLDPLIVWNLEVAVQLEGQECLSHWEGEYVDWYPTTQGWDIWRLHIGEWVLEAAEGGNITGIVVRLGVIDMCPFWCDENGSGDSHGPEPFFDNMYVYLVDASPITWRFNGTDRFQDNFPEHSGPGEGYVRMDHAGDLNWTDDDLPLAIGDSLSIYCNMNPAGGPAMEFCEQAGEERPRIYMWYRVIDGPNAGEISSTTGDPALDLEADGSFTDGLCYSPWIGSLEIVPGDGKYWNVAQADWAHVAGNTTPAAHKWAFDLNDAYFLPGDIIEYFFEGHAFDGNYSTAPYNAKYSNPEDRDSYFARCLPSGQSTNLFVSAGRDVEPAWLEGLRYNGFESFDIFTEQAPSSGQNNGLASRATLEDLYYYHYIIWDSGMNGHKSICDADDKTRDDLLLQAWFNEADWNSYLWVLGDNVANDLGLGNPFLTEVLGANLIESSIYYDDRTGIIVPTVVGTHNLLQYLGGDPEFWIYGGCPVVADFSLVSPIGTLSETLLEWEVDPGDGAVAGILNNDPDGNGTTVNDQGWTTRAVFTPWSYFHARDKGYATAAGIDYRRYFVGEVLRNIFDAGGHPGLGTPDVPVATELVGSHPNPFNPSTTITYALAQGGELQIRIFDLTGRRVATLWDGQQAAGNHELIWNGRDQNGHELSSGVYFLKFTAESYTQSQKLILLK
ncbi:T9SS type A sorting domain-containing protein [bacterium]|nr:T9SS type A sorting domain-containing protein [bacterium]